MIRTKIYFCLIFRTYLANKGTKVVVLEELRNNVGRKLFRVLDDKHASIVRPKVD